MKLKILQFYIRDGNAATRDTFKLIKVTLDRNTKDPKLVVQRLLELCNLPTDYVKTIKRCQQQSCQAQPQPQLVFHSPEAHSRVVAILIMARIFGTKEEEKKTLESWLKKNAQLAKERSAELDDLKEEVKKLQQAVTKRCI
ncbi:unnamed protein product [Ceratitis capitata]|uniref:(Mediterranean fruit fly) hypothetical protein n=1 Tax=Ceratitis capitata TaxID=7213 RepID=A0A811UV54_CERCA|nr:unnamed protein product [Ceratitis capitata]